MVSYSAIELRYARPLATALIDRPDFRAWFSGLPELETALHHPQVQSERRSPGMKNPYWFNYWCGKDSRCTCRVGTGIETDILLVFKLAEGLIWALHVEVKRPGDRLGDGQALSYPRRAACLANPQTRPRTVPPHTHWRTILVHEDTISSAAEAESFNVIHFHSRIAEWLSPYPEIQP